MAKSNENWLFGIVVGLGIFFVIILLTFFLRGFVQAKDGESSGGFFSKKNDTAQKKGDYSLQQAYVVCKSKVQSMDHLRIQSLRLDSRSSRFDEKSNQFIVFLDIDIVRDQDIVSEFARCHVSSVDNSLTEFRLKGDRGFLGGGW